MNKDALTAGIMLDAMRECEQAEAAAAKFEKQVSNLKAELADAKGELRAERRTVAMLEESLKSAAAAHAESEKRSAQMMADISAAFVAAEAGEKEPPVWLLDIVGRDGNNDMQRLRIAQEAKAS